MNLEGEHALGEFVHYWQGRAEIPDDGSPGMTCGAVIHYKSREVDVTETTKIYMFHGGYEDAKITFAEKGAISSDDLHIEHTVRWQRFEFDESSGVLTVYGDSKKFGSNYTVTINPVSP